MEHLLQCCGQDFTLYGARASIAENMNFCDKKSTLNFAKILYRTNFGKHWFFP
jgi:hypothetical protein